MSEVASEQEDEYKRRLREKKEKFKQEQAAKEAKQKADEGADSKLYTWPCFFALKTVKLIT